MRRGKLRHKILLQSPTTAKDSFGQNIVTWVDIGTVFACIEPASMASMRGASETILAGALTPVDVRVITLRVRQDVTPACRAIWGSVIYDLKAVRVTNRNDEMSFFATQGASDG